MRRFPLISALTLLVAIAFSACTPPPAGNVSLPVLFTDHMVLQRDTPINVWGWGDAGGLVTVSISETEENTRVGSDGSWSLELPAMPAGGPHTLTVAGAESLTMSDVLVGEVWVASGQSNMEWQLQNTNDAEAEIAAADYPNIRIFKVAHNTAYSPQTSVEVDEWRSVTPESIPNFSAVAYFFGRLLNNELDVPIGLIGSHWGGTPAEAWTSGEALLTLPDFADKVTALQAEMETNGALTMEERQAAWKDRIMDMDEGFEGEQALWADTEFDASSWSTMDIPQPWEDAGLPAYDGIVWFRKTFELPTAWSGQDVTLNLARIDDTDITWVNGEQVGSAAQFNADRSYSVPAGILSPGENTITVRVHDTGGRGGIYSDAAELFISSGRSMQSIAGEWLYQPGISPDVQMPTAPARLQNEPTTLYNAMLAPLIPYTIRGAIWYQGESNAERAYQYRTLFSTMILDWRAQWDVGDFPFYWVQLANFRAPQLNPVEAETWPELREAQSMALGLPNTAEAVIIDIGEANDIHPRNKQDVGMRLALPALNQVYGMDVVFSGPSYREMTIEGSTIRLHFDHVGGGLIAEGGELIGFAIAGEDQQFVWADAWIDGETIVLSNADVANPVAVRYAWADNPLISLYNAEGLPASPFRTDDWRGVTETE